MSQSADRQNVVDHMNTVFFKVNDRPYCILQQDGDDSLAIVDVISNAIWRPEPKTGLVEILQRLATP